jgi:hypothetical protein
LKRPFTIGANWVLFPLDNRVGHIHLNKFGLGLAPQAAARMTHVEAEALPLAPKTDPVSIAGDFCAVCSNLAQANALLLPSPHPLLPISIFADLQRLPAAVKLASQGRFHFSAHGPPSA